ncbi:MAG TPA: amidohydrolase family protein [Chitinophagaceae bacterium]|jgi:L-fuconolactonase|nr:amidohydrolase family protein [Chitinophagaceae bacterium]
MAGSTNNALQVSIDAHQHFWFYESTKHSWINDEMAIIRKDFLPVNLQPVLEENGIKGCVAVQADQREEETDFLLKLSAENNFIKGIVGWIDLRSDKLVQRLEYYSQFSAIKGFRHVLQGEEPSFMLQPDFLKGISKLNKYNFTYDILIFPNHLTAALQLVKQFPDQPFIIDHIAKPYIKNGLIDEWKKGMKALAVYPNVYCKISGMVTEGNMRNWKLSDFTPYLDVVTEAFGINRIVYGSDWPVCLAAGSYSSVINIVKNYFSSFSVEEQQLFFGKNAKAFYHLI